MNRKYLVFSVLVAVFFLMSAIVVNPAVAQKKPVILRLVIATPDGDWPQTFRDKEMAKRFNSRAKGQYRIEVQTGGTVKLPEFFDAVKSGAVEMSFSNWGMFSFLDPRMGLMETPFLFTSNASTAAAMKPLLALYDPILQETFNAKGLAMMSTGGLGLWSQKSVKTMSDMKGILTASVSPTTTVMLKALGASAVTIPFFEIPESLQRKVVDSSAQSAHGGVVFQYAETCKNFTAFFGVPAPAGYTINLDVWKKMPPHIQKILLQETQRAADWMNNIVVTELADRDLQTFKEKGVNVYYLPKIEREKWAKALEANKEKQLSSFGELGRQIKRISDEANRKHPYAADKTAM